MIKLTLNPDGDKKSEVFESKEVVIGNDATDLAHFKISDPSISNVHVKIIEEDSRYLIINAANDPFTSLNGLPFGKKTLKNHDQIQIGIHTIRFEAQDTEEVDATSQPIIKDVKDFQQNPTEQSTSDGGSPHSITPEETAPPLLDEEVESFDIDALLKEVELLDEPKEKDEAAPIEHAIDEIPEPQEQTPSTSALPSSDHDAPAPEGKTNAVHFELGDSPPIEPTSMPRPLDKIKENSDNSSKDSQGAGRTDKARKPVFASKESSITENWKMLTGVLIAIITLSTIICSGVYFRASGKNSQEEKKIAAGIADIAMAMTHAQLSRITPNKQNWADPDFIHNNLACVLSPNLHTQAQIDSQGQFTRYPYILRVYTSSDMNRFVVLAQPAPNLLQWLVHKKTLVIDSTAMEMRKITDLKKLNRLLANPSPFEGKNGTEISRVIKEGTLMPLASLAGNQNHWGFVPPKALAFIRPGAENYIYNAPRYYPFGESILRGAISLNQNNVTSDEVSELQEEMAEISEFPDIVLYTSQGLQNAIEAQKALMTFSPNSKFLVGYVKFNNKGYVASSHIFMNDDSHEIALMEPSMISTRSILDKPVSDNAYSSFDASYTDPLKSIDPYENMDTSCSPQAGIDTNHPLYLRLHAIASSRSRALAPLGEEISCLVTQQNSEIIPNFNEKIADLMQEYLQTDSMYRTRMVQELAQLYQEYSEMPLEDFMKFIEASKLTSFINEVLKSQKKQNRDVALDETKIEEQITMILKSGTLGELDDTVQETADLLNLEKFPDPERLIVLQEKMHNTVLDQLTHFLLSPDSIYAKANIEEQDRTTLIRILKTSWVTDSDEFDFFLSELDYLKSINGR